MTRTGKWGTKLTQNSPNLRGSCRVAIGLVGVLAVTAITSHPAQARHAAEPHHFRARVMTHGHDYSPPYSAIVVDANSGNVLHSASPDEPRHPASLTKIMTLYLLFERLEAGKLKLDSQLPVSEHASVQAPTKLGLKPGQTIAVEDAIRGLVTKSANDAAVVVAEAIGGNESDFAEMMTKKAHALGMSRTVYRNASGLPNDEQLTTARDQALLGRAIHERFPREYRYFSTPSFTYHGEAMRNHNSLLGKVEGVDGIKTGYTQASGFNLVTSVHRNNRHIVAVVLGGASAGARDARMRTLIEQHIAAASPQHTATAIAEATGAKPATRAAEAQPGKAAPTYTVASFSPPAAWPASKFVPATPADPALTATVAAPAAKMAAAAPGIDATKPQPKPAAAAAAAADANDTITPIRVKTVKVKLTQTHTAGLGPVAAPARDEPAPEQVAAPAPVAAPPPKVPATAPKTVAIAPATAAPVATPDVATPVMAAPVAAAAPVVQVPVAPARAAAAPVIAAPVVAAAPVVQAPVAPARAAAAPVIAAPVVAAAPVVQAPAAPARAAAAPAIAAPVVAAAPVAQAPAAPTPATAAPIVAAPIVAAAPVAAAPVAPRAVAMAAAPRTPEAPEPKADVAAHSAPTHTGWIVQVGAFDVERDAQQRLSNAHAKVGHALDNADPFTEPVVKGDKTLYRARFAGFPQKDEADAVCKQLKRNDIDCMTIRN
jgi:D-alanyl-D-alanine carboxypeptidase